MGLSRVMRSILLVLLIGVASSCDLLPTPEKLCDNPPSDFREADLVGTWEVEYGNQGIDRLVIKADGTFKQTYRDYGEQGYVYETSWNEWRVKRFSDGRVRLFLEGARYYDAGITTAEYLEVGASACWDPFVEKFVSMERRLVLNVRACDDVPGGLILKHMRSHSSDVSSSSEFYRVERP